MDKRLIIFVALAALVLSTHHYVTTYFWPPKPKPKGALAQKDAEKGKVGDAEKKKPGEKEPAKNDPDKKADPAKGEKDPVAGEEKQGDPKAETKPKEPPVWVTLGSLDPTTGYQMLVTLNNAGAALERAELNRYFELEDRRGYLGELNLTASLDPKGCKVQSVGAGTPAYVAGLRRGDVITAANDVATPGLKDLDKVREATRPGGQLTLTVDRAGKTLPLTVALVRPPLSVVKPEKTDDLSLLVTLATFDKLERDPEAKELPGVELKYRRWQLVSPTPTDLDGGTVQTQAVFKTDLPGGLEIYKKFTLGKALPAVPPTREGDLPLPANPGYELLVGLEIKYPADASDDPQPHTLAYALEGANGLPTEGAWYARKVSGAGIRDVEEQYLRSDGTKAAVRSIPCTAIADNTQEKPVLDQRLFTAGVDAQYFAAFMFPLLKVDKDYQARVEAFAVGPVNPARKMLTNTSVRIISRDYPLKPGDALDHQFRLFLGPKAPDVLSAYQLDFLVYYGWFGVIGHLLAGLLHFFHSLVGNYGLSIVLLVATVRSLLFPLSRKQALSAERMKQMQPELQRVKDRYKGKTSQQAKQDMAKEQMELLQKHGINPFAGCLPVLIQLPIFIALYNVLMSDIELRDAPLFVSGWWASNLAAPDMMFEWGNWFPFLTADDGQIGPYFNLLPIITVVLYLIQTAVMMPPPTDEQQAFQQKTMKIMMVVIGFMFYKVAAGLCVYFIVSTLASLIERQLVPKIAAAPAGGGASPGSSAGGSTKSPSAWPFGGGGQGNGDNGKDKKARDKDRRQKSKK